MFQFIENIIQANPDDWSFQVDDALAEIRLRLAAEPVIRIYVDNSPNFGNQASSVLVMQTLIDEYGFQGENKAVWMVYKAENADETRRKLSILIKGFDAANPDATTKYGGVTIEFITVEALYGDHDMAQINYGFTGAAGKQDEENWLAFNLKTKIFLQLQPYLWDLDGPDDIQYGYPYQVNDPFNLNDNAGVADTFSKRGWAILDQYWAPLPEDWVYYKDAHSPGVTQEMAEHTALAKELTDFVLAQGKGVKFMPVYGIKGIADAEDPDEPYYENQMLLPPDQVLPTVVSTALGGSSLMNPARTPAIVVSMNTDMDDISYDSSYTVSTGGATRSERSAQQSFDTARANRDNAQAALGLAQESGNLDIAVLQEELTKANHALTDVQVNNDAQILAKNARIDWLTVRNAPDGVTFKSSRPRTDKDGQPQPAITTDGLTAALNLLVNPETTYPAVLYLELGALPKIIFNYVMSLGTFPNVFEGANSAILALNQGKCYLRMKDITCDEDPIRYPAAWAPGADAYNAVHTLSLAAADGVTGALLANPTTPCDFVPQITLTTNYLSHYYITQNVGLRNYYTAIHDFYHNPENGKLGLGLAYMNQAAVNLGIPVLIQGEA